MTPFTDIYDIFLNSSIANDLVSQMQQYPHIVKEKLENMLFDSSELHFKECEQDLTQRTDTHFMAELTDEEKRILALGMELEYLNTVLIPNETAVRSGFYTKDYVHFSPNAKVKNLSEIETKTRANLRTAIRRYQYYNMIRGV